jgi:hypothetical protein
MAKIELPVYDPDPDDLLSQLGEQGKVIRQQRLLEHDTLQARQALEELELQGKIARFPVGDHILVRDLRDDADRGEGWPHEDLVEDVESAADILVSQISR